MNRTRIEFDQSLPFVVATSRLVIADRRFRRGEPFPWREIGVDPLLLFQLWVTLKVDCQPEQRSGESPRAVVQPTKTRRKRRAA